MVLSSFEKFHPRDHSAAPRKPRPSRSISSCAGHRARGRGTAVCSPPGPPAPRHTPGARIFKQNVTGEQGARSRRPPPPAETPDLGAASGATPSTGAAAGGAGASPAPSRANALHRPGPRPPALPAAPNLRPASPPGRCALEGAGIPASERLGLPLSSGPSPSAYLCCGPPAAAPEVLAALAAGLLGFSAGASPAPSRERAGGGHRLLLGLAVGIANRKRSRPSDVT